jgi:lysine-ketoglutarate reductase/saccharopine dehydrogenase-like protein (TIGR00300 family)
MPSEVVVLEGHIIDTLMLPKVLDEILISDGTYEIVDLKIGNGRDDPSAARIKVIMPEEDKLDELLDRLQQFGANAATIEDAELVVADVDGAFPPGFYSSTNLETEVRVNGHWIPVARTEMDCGVAVDESSAGTLAMTDVRRGMKIVMAGRGIRVQPLEPAASAKQAFEFMSSDVSSEKPKALLVEQVADQMRSVKEQGKRILWVAGPAVIHTGSAPDLCALIKAGYVDALFAGNGVAAHDIESNMFGTSLGVYLSHGHPAEHGHEHHIRAINEIRRHGSFKAAIDAGVFDDGIVYQLIANDCDYIFGGSVRDDGPLPEVVSDMLEVQRRLRDIIWGRDGNDLIGYCIVVGTMLHGIATGNCLPASVPLACIDINQATVTKLMDRGSFQSMGIITDVGLFIRGVAEHLASEHLAPSKKDARARVAGSNTPT